MRRIQKKQNYANGVDFIIKKQWRAEELRATFSEI